MIQNEISGKTAFTKTKLHIRKKKNHHILYIHTERDVTFKRSSENTWQSPKVVEHFSIVFSTQWMDCIHLLSPAKQY